MEPRPASKRVLIADDYPDVAEMLAALLALAAPFPVEIAIVEDGAQALARALCHVHECLILDVDMPVMDGISSAEAIRSAVGIATPLLIALTGDPRHSDAPSARVFDHFLMKPADIDQLIKLVGSAEPRG